jgi:hypothetical protein
MVIRAEGSARDVSLPSDTLATAPAELFCVRRPPSFCWGLFLKNEAKVKFGRAIVCPTLATENATPRTRGEFDQTGARATWACRVRCHCGAKIKLSGPIGSLRTTIKQPCQDLGESFQKGKAVIPAVARRGIAHE